MTLRIIFHPDGSRETTDDGVNDAAPPDELAALRAEVATLRAAAVTIAQRATAMTKVEAEALVSAAAVTKG